MKGVVICVLVVLAMAHLMIEPTQAFTYADVDPNLSQCVSYLTGTDANPLPGCCDGVKRVRAMRATTDDKRLACNCIKQAATRIHNIKDSAVGSLPDACGSPLPFPIGISFYDLLGWRFIKQVKAGASRFPIGFYRCENKAQECPPNHLFIEFVRQ